MDCYTKVPLDYLPGYINETIYGDNIETGWAWYPYPAAPATNAVNNKQLQVNATYHMPCIRALIHACSAQHPQAQFIKKKLHVTVIANSCCPAMPDFVIAQDAGVPGDTCS